MKKKLLSSFRLRVVMLVAVLCSAFTGQIWAVVVSGTTYNTTSTSSLPTGWTANGSGSSYIQLTSSSNYIQTSEFTQNGFTSIKIKARKYGGPSADQALITVSWYEGNSETVLGTIAPTSTTLTDYTISSPTNPTGNTTGYVKIQCKGASSSKGSGVSQVTITYTAGTSTTPTVSVSPVSIAFGDNVINSSHTETFDVTFANLTQDLSVRVGSGLTGVSVNPTTISKDASSPQSVTVTYAPTAEGSISGNITVSNTDDNLSETVAVTGSAYDPSNIKYYEKVTSSLLDWTGDYVFTGINNSTYYALTGVNSNLGTTASLTVTDEGIISNATTNAYKVTVAATTNGYSLYMDGVGYLTYSGSSNQLQTANTFTASTCEWTISFASGVATITNVGSNTRMLQFNYNSGNPRFACYTSSQVKLTLFKLDDGTPSITADNVNLAYDDTSGSISYTLTNEVTGGTLTAVSSESWLTVGTPTSGNIALTCDANNETTSRTATVTLTYSYGNNETVTKDVTITQAAAPVIYTTIPTLFEAATNTETSVHVTFNNWVVSGVSTNGKNVFVTDNSGNGFVIYDNNAGLNDTYAVGNILSGTAVTCNLVQYNGFAELTGLDASDLTITSGGTVTAANVAMANLAGVNTGALVSYTGLTCSVDNSGNTPKYYLSDGTTTLQVYNALYAFGAFEAGKTYNITGIYQQYNSTKEIMPRSADDIVEVVVTTPSITVDPATATPSASDVEGTLDITYENLSISDMSDFDVQFYDSEGTELTSGNEPDWIVVDVAAQDPNIGEGYVVSYIMNENTGAARTAYFKVYAMDGEDFVYSNLVTVTQAAPVVDYASLPFEYDGNGANNLPQGLSVSGLGTYSSSPKMKFDGNGDYLVLKLNETPGTITFDVKGNGNGSDPQSGTFDIMISSDGENYSTLATYSSFSSSKTTISLDNLNAGTRYIKWIYTTKSVGNVALGNINVIAGYAKTVTSNGWATWIAPRDVEVPTGVTAYMVENTTETSASLKELLTIPANEPVLLKNEGSYEFPVTSEILDDVSGNLLSVSDGTIAAGKVAYVLAKNGDTACFKKWTGEAATLNGRVVMIVDEAAAPARGFFTLDDDDNTTTGIDYVNVNLNDNNVYDLQGRCVAQPAKGLYIVNGKKVIIK